MKCELVTLTSQSVERISSVACVSEKAVIASAQLLICLIVTSFSELDRRISHARTMISSAVSQEARRIECALQDIVRSTDSQVRGISTTIELAKDQVTRFTQEVRSAVDLELCRLRYELDSLSQKIPDASMIVSSEEVRSLIHQHECKIAETLLQFERKYGRDYCDNRSISTDRDTEIEEMKNTIAIMSRKLDTIARLISHHP